MTKPRVTKWKPLNLRRVGWESSEGRFRIFETNEGKFRLLDMDIPDDLDISIGDFKTLFDAKVQADKERGLTT